MGCVREQAMRVLSEQLGLAVYSSGQAGRDAKLPMVSSLPIGGPLEGFITMAAEEKTVSDIMYRLIGNNVDDGEVPSMLRDTLNELLNVVVGNSATSLDNAGLRILVSPPLTVHDDSSPRAAIESSSSQCRIETGSGPIVLSYQPGQVNAVSQSRV